MDLELMLYSLALILAVTVTAILGAVGMVWRKRPGTRLFSALVLASGLYALGSLFEIRALSVGSVHAWLTVEYFGITMLGPTWLLLASQMTGRRETRPSRLEPLLFVIPLISLVFLITNDLHHLFYSSIALSFNGPFTIPRLGKGVWYWVQFAYMNLTILAGALLMLRQALRAAPVFRNQALIMFSGSLLPWVGMLIYQMGLSPRGLDVSPFGICFAGLLFALGLFRYNLLDLSPVVFENVFAVMRDGVLVVDRKRRLIGMNPACSAILPELTRERIGESIDSVLAGHPQLLDNLARPGTAPQDLSLAVHGSLRHFQVEASLMSDARRRPSGTILNLSDISARVALHEELERIAATDGLTNLPNRRNFMQHAERELERGRRNRAALSFIMLDLDHFKAINDRYGHQAGDAVLVRLARVCNQNLRVTDLPCRYGGEEILILLPGIAPDGARVVAERIRSALAGAIIMHDDQAITCTASLGIAGRSQIPPDASVRLDELINEADAALYRAKDAGRNRVSD